MGHTKNSKSYYYFLVCLSAVILYAIYSQTAISINIENVEEVNLSQLHFKYFTKLYLPLAIRVNCNPTTHIL